MRHTPGIIILSTVFAFGCGRGEDAAPADGAAEDSLPALVQQPAESAAAPAPSEAQPAPAVETPPTPTPQRTAPAQQFAARQDRPFVTADTGAVSPGMSEAAVIQVWGDPVTRRADGAYTYLFFRNGCEASCGMYDLVILEAGQVVDAVVRFGGHRYEGTSSSPAGSEPVSTPPTMERLNPPAGSEPAGFASPASLP